MFQLEISSKLMKTIVACLKEFVDSIEITIDSTGMHISTVDEAHVCMIQFYLAKNEFTQFEAQKTTKLNFMIGILEKAIKNAKKELTLSADLSKSNSLNVKYFTASRTMNYNIPCKKKLTSQLVVPKQDTLGTVILIELIKPGFKPSQTKPVQASDQALGQA